MRGASGSVEIGGVSVSVFVLVLVIGIVIGQIGFDLRELADEGLEFLPLWGGQIP